MPLCSRNFQNVKLRLHGVRILQAYGHSNFTFLKTQNIKKCNFDSFTDFIVYTLNFSHFEH